jgi:hypothetical protein
MDREMTELLLEKIDAGMLDARDVVKSCVKYMSADEVEDMMEREGFGSKDELS